MSVGSLRAYARWMLAAAIVLLAPQHAIAQNWESGKAAFANYSCSQAGCHSGATDPLLDPGRGQPQVIQDKLNATVGSTMAMGQPNTSQLDPLRTATINATVADLAGYLAHLDFPTATVTTTNLDVGTAVAKLTTNTVNYTVTNNGDQALTGLSAVVANNTDFAVVVPGTCASVAAGNSCTLTITFKPQSVSSIPLPTTTTLTLTTPGTYAGSIAVSLHGVGLAPLVLGGAANVPFNTGDAAKLQRVVANTSGDVQVCLAGETTFPAVAGDFTVSGVTLDGTGCGTVTPIAPFPRNIDLNVTFNAAAGSGPRNAKLNYQRVASATDTAVAYHLQGNIGPIINFSDANPFNHGVNDQTEVDGNVVTTRTINISNGGNADLHVTSFAITSVDPAHPEVAAEYTLGGTGCQPTATLTAGSAPCVLTLNFNPSALGLQAAQLTIVSDSKSLPQPSVIALNGVGKHGPRLAVAEGTTPLTTNSTIDFTFQRLGQTYAPQTLTLTNGGTLGDLELSLPATSAVAGFSIVQSTGCGATLAPAATCTLAISFVPTLIQHYGGAIQLQSRPAGSTAAFDTFVVNVSGDGTDQAPALSWRDPNSLTSVVTGLTFAAIQAGNSAQQQIALYNAGPGTATLKFANVVGADSGNYTLDASACLTTPVLGQNTSCTIVVRFSPLAAGPKAASLQMVSDGNGPVALTLSGSGIAGASSGALALSPASVAFDTTTVGASSAPIQIALTNSGTGPLNLLALSVSGPYLLQSLSCQTPPFALMPGATCTVAVSFVPTGSGSTAGTLQVTSDASSTPSQAALTGSSQAAANVSSGGCSSIGTDPRRDPTLWTLVFLAAVVLWQRRRTRSREGREGSSRSDETER